MFFSMSGFLIVIKLSFSEDEEGLIVRLEDRRLLGVMVTVFLGEEEAMLEIMVTGVLMFATGELARLRGVRQPSELRLLI